ncbi:hypothetical protein Golomagni_04560 [Golovinomyces magnicellulatus]|nr:hypothetical protein Golomagni_04560 [Golovinomyces magnicellulatus]
MSSSTPLLPKQKKKEQDQSIFLRICHSPWKFLEQRTVIGLRGLIVFYLLISFITNICLEVSHSKSGCYFMSRLPWLVIKGLIHMIILMLNNTQIWTAMHLYVPYKRNQASSAAESVKRFLSPPAHNPRSTQSIGFSIFYTAANTFPYVSTFIFWAVLVPSGRSFISPLYDQKLSVQLFIISYSVISCLISYVEVFFLNCVRRQDPIYIHVIALTLLSWLYLVWAYLGYYLIGTYVWYFMDTKEVGSPLLLAAFFLYTILVIFCKYLILKNLLFLTRLVLLFLYGLTCSREISTKRKNNVYQQSPSERTIA